MLLKDVSIGHTVKVNIVANITAVRWWDHRGVFDPAKETIIATKVGDGILAWHEDQIGTDPSFSFEGYAGASYISPDQLHCVLAPP